MHAEQTEKRRRKRRHLLYYLKVFDRDSHDLIGEIIDITTDGFKLISDRPIELHNTYHFQVELPGELMHRTELNLSVESMWHNKDINPDYYDTGFRMLHLPETEAAAIESLIDKYGFEN